MWPLWKGRLIPKGVVAHILRPSAVDEEAGRDTYNSVTSILVSPDRDRGQPLFEKLSSLWLVLSLNV